MRQGMLAYGFVRGFKGSDTLLFLGDPNGVQKFAELLRSPREFGTRVVVNDPTEFEPHGASVAVEFDQVESMAEATTRPDGETEVVWKLSNQDATGCADALIALASTHQPGHQYVEKRGAIQIMVSVGEYDDAVLSSGGE